MNAVCEEVLFNVVNQETSISMLSLSQVCVCLCVCVCEADEAPVWVSNNGRIRVERQVWSELPNRMDMSLPVCPAPPHRPQDKV